jgi:solute carrier family 25 thiamine pyrophosphate transporter 19
MSAAKHTKSNPVTDATAGAIAGCAARFVVGPLDVIKIRFQVQLEPIAKRAAGLDPTSLASKYTGLRQALTTIVKEEGIKVWHTECRCKWCLSVIQHSGHTSMQGLWRGTLPGQLLTVPYTAVQFVTLQQVRYFAHQSGISDAMGGKSLSFVSGAMAGAAATIAAYPFDILRTTLAAQGEPKVHLMSYPQATCLSLLTPRSVNSLGNNGQYQMLPFQCQWHQTGCYCRCIIP